MQEKKDSACVLLEQNKCSVHHYKPLVCFFYPISYDEEKKEYTLFFRQTCKETPETKLLKKPFLIPIKY